MDVWVDRRMSGECVGKWMDGWIDGHNFVIVLLICF